MFKAKKDMVIRYYYLRFVICRHYSKVKLNKQNMNEILSVYN